MEIIRNMVILGSYIVLDQLPFLLEVVVDWVGRYGWVEIKWVHPGQFFRVAPDFELPVFEGPVYMAELGGGTGIIAGAGVGFAFSVFVAVFWNLVF